jgi:hypothetical protein
MKPPTTGPSVGASEASPPTIAAAITRCWPWKKTNALVNTIGIIEPPRKPCSARNAIICSMSVAVAHNRLARVKPAAEAANSQWVENTRLSQPESGITTISAIR